MSFSRVALVALLMINATGSAQDVNVEQESSDKREWIDLFDGESLEGWKSTNFGGEGKVYVQDKSLFMDTGVMLTGITYQKEFPKQRFEIEIEARLVEGGDFFCGLTFPVNESHCSFIVGGWGGSVVGLSNIDDRDASENDTTSYHKFEKAKWYKIRTVVTPEKIQCWLDEKMVVDQELEGKAIGIRPEVVASKPLGISAFQTKSEIRMIRYRELKE